MDINCIPQENDTFALNELLPLLLDARRELSVAYSNFDFATTSDLIDICSHQITIAQAKYDYILKKAKKNHLKDTSQKHIVASNAKKNSLSADNSPSKHVGANSVRPSRE